MLATAVDALQGKWPSLLWRFVLMHKSATHCSEADPPHMHTSACLHVHWGHKCAQCLPHSRSQHTQRLFQGLSQAVLIVPKATQYNKGQQLTAWCAAAFEMHKWLGWICLNWIQPHRHAQFKLSKAKRMLHVPESGCTVSEQHCRKSSALKKEKLSLDWTGVCSCTPAWSEKLPVTEREEILYPPHCKKCIF